ncbi:poly [ADP-ribose] polymerase [Venturia canescens]|uniref:poly [ADP-ribose] polymerase n=1 Tax=Venturia canescens TaxID=32260 RepID=UPI001C9BBDC0|nr:poly [ADP-ribose] polymerase [Venturia canescens]
MSETLPFSVEYAKSGRARCQGCKNPIDNASLRIAKVVQSPFHDGTIVKWFHPDCFFTKQRPKSTADISNFDSIRWEDQQMIQKKIEETCGVAVPTKGKGKKRGATSNAYKDYTVEYAKSNRSTCVGCEAPIIKGSVRISKKDFESEKGVMLNGIDRWHHLDCFAKLRNDLCFYDSGDMLPGANSLKEEDLKLVKTTLPKMKAADLPPPPKKVKSEPMDEAEEKEMKKQNEMFFKMRDQLNTLSRKDLVSLLEKNNQNVPESQNDKLDNLADLMVFGVPKPCKKCTGQFVYVSGLGYKCTGNLTEWTKCEEVTQDPKRIKFSVPKHLKEEIPFLGSYKPKIQRRIVKVTAPSTSSAVKKEEEYSGPKIKDKALPLKGMQFVILNSIKKKADLTHDIMSLGGQVVAKITDSVAAVIAKPKFVEEGNSKKLDEARNADIQVISEDFVDEAKDYTDAPISLITKKSICDWGSDPTTRVASSMAKSASRGKSVYEKSSSGKIKLTVKGGGAVDPDSELEGIAHIHQDSVGKYTAVLGLTDIQLKKNSYYKMQILKHDFQNKYWLFRSWGRIGTTIGGKKTDSMSLSSCIKNFEELYEEKTGNEWSARNQFIKKPGKMCPIDVDHGEDDVDLGKFDSELQSNLKPAVQDLIRIVFDVQQMKKVMLEFELDTDKMPLGKLSKKQLQQAFKVLTELQEITKNGQPERIQLIDLSNRFYTLVPHSFGVKDVPILETQEDIKNKCDMLDALLEMEIAYNMLNVKNDGKKNPLDLHYEQLNTEIDVLDENSEEYEVVKQYVKNTHAATHGSYDLEIGQVYTIKRSGEEQRFKPFKKLHNRKLLWHGSRTTNFAGILSQGLRIAPPEAPVTGYMFGKGIYFADMVSKAANYCCTNSSNSTGLMLLCEVALGDMYERKHADYIEKLPKGKHSTKGLGSTQPDPEKVYKMKDGVEVPYGSGVPVKFDNGERPSLLYNEFIIYDVAQVKAKYLIKMNFKYKY